MSDIFGVTILEFRTAQCSNRHRNFRELSKTRYRNLKPRLRVSTIAKDKNADTGTRTLDTILQTLYHTKTLNQETFVEQVRYGFKLIMVGKEVHAQGCTRLERRQKQSFEEYDTLPGLKKQKNRRSRHLTKKDSIARLDEI